MPPDASASLVAADVPVAVLPADDVRLVVDPRRLRTAIEALTDLGWTVVPAAGSSAGAPDRVVLSHRSTHDVTLVTSLVPRPDLRALFPIRTVDVLHRSGSWLGVANPVHPVDSTLAAIMHHASTGDRSQLRRVAHIVGSWSDRECAAFASVVRRAGAQLPVLVALDAGGSSADVPITPRYRMWRGAARRWGPARRATRRSTIASIGSLLGLVRSPRHSARSTSVTAVVHAIERESEAIGRNAPHSRWRGAVALRPSQYRDVCRIAISLIKVDRMLRTRSFLDVVQRCGITLESDGSPTPSPIELPPHACDDARLVEAVGRLFIPGNPCLRTSVVIAQRLTGYRPVVRLGVSEVDGRFDGAHAWVEVGGRSFGEDPRFAALRGSTPLDRG